MSLRAVAHAPRVPALDGIRGAAILGVMLFHMSMVPPKGHWAVTWANVTQNGGLGVDVFFVLSGFLISGILFEARDEPRYFRNFYARRVLRIFPLYYAVAAFSFLVLPRLEPWTVAKFAPVNRDAAWYWLHLSNFSIARRGQFVHGIMDVSWSLAIEEQFYLLWPSAILLMPPRAVRWSCVVLIAASCASRALLTANSASPIAVYTLTFCRLDGLALGSLVASIVRTVDRRALTAWATRALLAALALLGFMAVPLSASWDDLRDAACVHLLVSMFTASAIFAALAVPRSPPLRMFEWAPMRALGRYSYALYLFHYPITALVRDKVLPPARMPVVWGSSLPSLLFFYLVAGSAALCAAVLSWHAYEKHFLRLKRFFE